MNYIPSWVECTHPSMRQSKDSREANQPPEIARHSISRSEGIFYRISE